MLNQNPTNEADFLRIPELRMPVWCDKENMRSAVLTHRIVS